MTYYFWRIKNVSDRKAIWFLFFAINEYIMNEILDKKFNIYLCLFGKKVLAI